MQITVNGTVYQVADEPDRPLLWVLRDELGLTGTKYGCGIGICGSCDVHVDGVAVRSCLTNLFAVEGKSIRTIEGLADDDSLHPVQQAFQEEEAFQCGWCTSGQIMRAAAFLASNTRPTSEEIASAMNGNYCRCGAYGRIQRAVAKAAERMEGGSDE
jgi:isoquinoline 1-oxidoreductase alpha subunit